jgi:hypothetical protein
VDAKFGSLWGGWCSLESSSTFGVELWKFIRKSGGTSRVTLDLRWEKALRLDSCMISGVGIWPLRKFFQFYLALLAKRMPLLQIT